MTVRLPSTTRFPINLLHIPQLKANFSPVQYAARAERSNLWNANTESLDRSSILCSAVAHGKRSNNDARPPQDWKTTDIGDGPIKN